MDKSRKRTLHHIAIQLAFFCAAILSPTVAMAQASNVVPPGEEGLRDDVASEDVASEDVASEDVASEDVASEDVASEDVASEAVAPPPPLVRDRARAAAPPSAPREERQEAAAPSSSSGDSCWSTGLITAAIVVGIAAAVVVVGVGAIGGVICLTVVGANIVEEAICAPLCGGLCGGAAGITGLCAATLDDTCSSLTAPCSDLSGSFLRRPVPIGVDRAANAMSRAVPREGDMRF